MPASETVGVVGTYTEAESEGLYTHRIDRTTGALTEGTGVDGGPDPSFLTFGPTGEWVYAVNEIDDGAVAAFELDRETGTLSLANRTQLGERGPCYCSIEETGACLMTAQFFGGSISILPIQDGRLGDVSQTIHHSGSGPHPELQTEAHPHSIVPGPDGEYVYVPDLGTDEVVIYELDPATPSLEESSIDPITLPPGAGPRHLEFHPNGEYAYLINQLDSTIVAFERAAGSGVLEEIATVPTLPSEYEEENHAAEIQVHPSGEYLYGSNRGHDSIAIYEIGRDGRPQLLDIEPSGGEWPRNFAIEPEGSYLYAANADSNAIVPFEIREDGRLRRIDQARSVESPVCVRFD